MMTPSHLLGLPKRSHIDLNLQGIDLSRSQTISDVIIDILSHADKDVGNLDGKNPADNLGTSFVITLRSFITQQFGTSDEELSTKRTDEETNDFKKRCLRRKEEAINILLGENQSMVGLGQDEIIIRARLERLLIEANKDNLDMVPAIDFVEKNLDVYQAGLDAILTKKPSPQGLAFAKGIQIIGAEDIIEPQIGITEAGELLARFPETLLKISQMTTIDFHKAKDKEGNGYPIIPIPKFNEKGDFHGQATLLKPSDFPRKKGQSYISYDPIKIGEKFFMEEHKHIATEDDHLTRILVGVSNGFSIFPTPLPKTVSENNEAIKMYQICVFLHEFFHTIEVLHRTYKKNTRRDIILELNNSQYTLQEWWESFEQLMLSNIEPHFISYYASVYKKSLNEETKNNGDWGSFEYAIGEQIAESFVAYMLNIQANPDGWTDFKSESFGNTEQLRKYQAGESSAANQKWLLIDKLCKSTVIT